MFPSQFLGCSIANTLISPKHTRTRLPLFTRASQASKTMPRTTISTPTMRPPDLKIAPPYLHMSVSAFTKVTRFPGSTKSNPVEKPPTATIMTISTTQRSRDFLPIKMKSSAQFVKSKLVSTLIKRHSRVCHLRQSWARGKTAWQIILARTYPQRQALWCPAAVIA